MRPISDANVAHAEIARRLAQIAHQPRDEPRAVVPLQGDFLIVDDDGLHQLLNRDWCLYDTLHCTPH